MINHHHHHALSAGLRKGVGANLAGRDEETNNENGSQTFTMVAVAMEKQDRAPRKVNSNELMSGKEKGGVCHAADRASASHRMPQHCAALSARHLHLLGFFTIF